MEKFWMVYVEGRSSPTVKHRTKGDALWEAERLLGLPQNWNSIIFVLEAVGYAQTPKTPISYTSL